MRAGEGAYCVFFLLLGGLGLDCHPHPLLHFGGSSGGTADLHPGDTMAEEK